MANKPKKKTVLEWDYQDLNLFITEKFGKPNGIPGEYECVAYEEWGNYESHVFDVDGEDFEQESIDDMISDKKYYDYNTGDILNYLCHKGLLKKGEYLISVFW